MRSLCFVFAVGVLTSAVYAAPAFQQGENEPRVQVNHGYVITHILPQNNQENEALEAKGINEDKKVKEQFLFLPPIFSFKSNKINHEKRMKPINGAVQSLDGEAVLQKSKWRNIFKQVMKFYKMHHGMAAEDSDVMAAIEDLPELSVITG